MAVKFTLGKKIVSGIFLMLILMLVVGGVGYFGLKGVLGVTELSFKVLQLNAAVTEAGAQTDRYLLGLSTGNKALEEASTKATLKQLETASKLIQDTKNHPSIGEAEVEKLNQAVKSLGDFGEIFGRYRKVDAERAKIEAQIEESLEAMLKNMAQGVIKTEQMVFAGNLTKASFSNYAKRPNEENWASVEDVVNQLEKAVGVWFDFVSTSEQLGQLARDIKKQFGELKAACYNYTTMVTSQQELKKQIETNGAKLSKICEEFVASSTVKMQNQTRVSIMLMFGFIGFALLVGMIYAAISARGIVGKLKSVITGVSDASTQVSAAADEIAAASQSMAEGSSEQASSIEETSASLEQMSSLTRQNAERAREAKVLMGEVQQIVEKVSTHMNDMAGAVTEITSSSEETGKIIRTIDEIAFQTNLLALNAAVEAARAGEAGAGFAVVADEVRSLAKRAAEASRNTAHLIETTIRNVKRGKELTTSTQDAFKENVTITVKVGQLVDEISEASNEQALGIEQVNHAISEMNSVTQKSASSAEESASAALEMSAQAEQMTHYVAELGSMVGTNGKEMSVPQQANEKRGREQVLSVSVKDRESSAPRLEADRESAKETESRKTLPGDRRRLPQPAADDSLDF
ncbi:MAG: methyl-accepting chemotaxis protein [Desulfobacteraceae bacterium]|nr:methyl-accepting chemotaxis protein [Desulfobacteraceae bacterium]